MSTVRCTQSHVRWVGEGDARTGINIPDWMLLDSNDPLVKGHEHLFVPVEQYVEKVGRRRSGRTQPEDDTLMRKEPAEGEKSETKPVEQATAAPGERRSVGRPRGSGTAGKKDGEV